MKTLDPEDWSAFWKAHTLTSFGDLFPDNYDGSILHFWKSQLVGRPDHVVDLACGNGALTWICDSILNSEGIESTITGIDVADISPFKTLKRNPDHFPAVHFIGNTPMEKLPFPDDSVDLFVSQYGLEYSNLKQTIPELSRKLAASGKMCFILHDQESTIIKGATEHLEDFRIVVDEIGMHDFALDLDRLHEKYKNPGQRAAAPEYNNLMLKIRHASARVDNIARSHPKSSPLHLYVRRLNTAFEKPKKKLKTSRKKQILHARDAFRAHIERVEDLRAAALSQADRERLVSLLKAEDMTVTEIFTLAYESEANMGTALVAER